jgi:hypothetical protein
LYEPALAVLATEPQKVVGQNPALEEGLELLGDVLWDKLASASAEANSEHLDRHEL